MHNAHVFLGEEGMQCTMHMYFLERKGCTALSHSNIFLSCKQIPTDYDGDNFQCIHVLWGQGGDSLLKVDGKKANIYLYQPDEIHGSIEAQPLCSIKLSKL